METGVGITTGVDLGVGVDLTIGVGVGLFVGIGEGIGVPQEQFLELVQSGFLQTPEDPARIGPDWKQVNPV